MAGKLRLASSGGDIKIWDTPELSLVKAFIPHSQPVGSLCWSPNNQCLASAASDKVVVTYVKGDVYSPIEVSSGEGNTCVAFNSSSRYLLIGGKSKMLSIWDMKTKSVKKTYKDHKDVVSCLAFNWNDTTIASGSVNGDILLHNVLTGQASDPIRLAKTQAVRDIQFSHFKKSLLGAVSDDGALNLWDSNSRKLLTSFSTDHKAPATGLSFSPMNDMLLCSVGLDKRIVFYDVQGKKSVKVMTAESPLTAVDFMADGATLAVGSTRGKIFIYDLRSGSTPVGTTVAHKTSVQCLSFQSSIKVNSTGISNKSSKPAASKPSIQLPEQPVSTTTTSPPSPPTNKQWTSTGQNLTVKQNGLKDDDEDIFSPLREVKTPVLNNRVPAHVGSEQDSSTSYKGGNTSDVSGIFSPLGSNQSGPPRVPLGSNPVLHLDGNAAQTIGEPTTNVPTTVQNSRSMNNAGVSSTRSLTNLRPAQDLGATKSYSDTQLITNSGQLSSRPSSDSSAARLQLGSTFDTRPLLDGVVRKFTEDAYSTENSLGARNGVGSEVLENNKQPFNSTSAGSDRRGHQDKAYGNPVHGVGAGEQLMEHQEVISISTVGPHTTGENRRAEDKVSSEQSIADDARLRPEPLSSGAVAMVAGDVSGAAGGGSGLLPFQVQFIKNLIDESLDEFRVALHRDIVNVQVEMLRQFQIQQNELKAMLQKYSVNETLVTEIERLKEENNRLKSKY